MSFAKILNKQAVRTLITSWISTESNFNYISCALDVEHRQAVIYMNGPGVLAGAPFVDALFQDLNCSVSWKKEEGSFISNASTPVAVVSGPADELIHGERLATTILSRASGVATLGQKLKKALTEANWKGDLLGPRRLTPGFSLVEEYALLVVGVASCKILSSVVLKQPHVAASGSVKKAIDSIREKIDPSIKVQVQCFEINDAKSAASAGADIILFENLSSKDINVISQLKSNFPKLLVEVNGSYDESSARTYAISNVNYISSEKLSNGYATIDFQVKYEKRPLEEGVKHGSPGVKKEQTDIAPAKTSDSLPNPSATKRPHSEATDTITPVKRQNGTTDESQPESTDKPAQARSNSNRQPIRQTQPQNNQMRSGPVNRGPLGPPAISNSSMYGGGGVRQQAPVSGSAGGSPNSMLGGMPNLSSQTVSGGPGSLSSSGPYGSGGAQFRMPLNSPQMQQPPPQTMSNNKNYGLPMSTGPSGPQSQPPQQPWNPMGNALQGGPMMNPNAGAMAKMFGAGARWVGGPGIPNNPAAGGMLLPQQCRSCGVVNQGSAFCRNCRSPLR